MRKKAVFLDKDGTLVEDVPYNVEPDRIRMAPGAERALRLIHASGYEIFVVSNQSGVARGYFREEELGPMELRLHTILAEAGIPLAGFYYCPHYPEGNVPGYAVACYCRKPAPGLLYRAAKEHKIDLGASWLVGDILDDVEAGHRAGCRTILINNGNETVWHLSSLRMPHHIVGDLVEAASVINAGPPTSSSEAHSVRHTFVGERP